jgi:hypothetical protein
MNTCLIAILASVAVNGFLAAIGLWLMANALSARNERE